MGRYRRQGRAGGQRGARLLLGRQVCEQLVSVGLGEEGEHQAGHGGPGVQGQPLGGRLQQGGGGLGLGHGHWRG